MVTLAYDSYQSLMRENCGSETETGRIRRKLPPLSILDLVLPWVQPLSIKAVT